LSFRFLCPDCPRAAGRAAPVAGPCAQFHLWHARGNTCNFRSIRKIETLARRVALRRASRMHCVPCVQTQPYPC
jgi:hypothetical protein